MRLHHAKRAADDIPATGSGRDAGDAGLEGFAERNVLRFDRIDRAQFGKHGVGHFIAVRSFEADGFFEDADMAMRIDDAGGDVSSGGVDDFGVGILTRVERSNGFNFAVGNQDVGDLIIQFFHGD